MAKVDEPFRSRIAKESVRSKWIAASIPRILWGPAGRGTALAKALASLYETKQLRDLPPGPTIVFNSTDLITGKVFEMSRDVVGSSEHQWQPTPAKLPLSVAVAASAAFPLSRAIVRLKLKDLGYGEIPLPALSLVDGGVYDNLGLDWFSIANWGDLGLKPHADFLVLVNASGTLNVRYGRTGVLRRGALRYGGLRLLPRTIEIQYAQTLAPRIAGFHENYGRPPYHGIYLWLPGNPRTFLESGLKPNILSTIGPSQEPMVEALARGALDNHLAFLLSRVRTDLDKFSRTEADLLSYHGYWSTHAELTFFKPELALSQPRWVCPDWATPTQGTRAALEADLERASHRFLRRLRGPTGRLLFR